jgi:Flp pilus assembly CpaE family ATPase
MEAVNAGRLIQEVRPKSKLSQEIIELGKVVTGAEPKPVKRAGLLGFLKKGD